MSKAGIYRESSEEKVSEQSTYPVVDLFAGPGGLGEGFSSFRRVDGTPAYRLRVSVEKDPAAHRTLRFRAFTRAALEAGLSLNLDEISPHRSDAELELVGESGAEAEHLWSAASREALRAELGGNEESMSAVSGALAKVGRDSILIGGPPCQAYSLVGRARNRGIKGYRAEDDDRHFLYREYVRILHELQPVAFVMENVKGILSAKVRERGVFDRIARDLREAGYGLYPLAPPSASGPHRGGLFDRVDPRDFVIRAEDFGVPQARHRVIVVGLREDVATSAEDALTDTSLRERMQELFSTDAAAADVGSTLADLPRIRSRLSRRNEGFDSWYSAVDTYASQLRSLSSVETILGDDYADFTQIVEEARTSALSLDCTSGKRRTSTELSVAPDLARWLNGSSSRRIFNHEARGHMASDLARYLYASAYGKVRNVSPKAADFPAELAPDHKNWKSGKFADRFRVQVDDRPATTVTSHISKDGHYFIHPDPGQCRSLTVREAARLQTFPDDYIFFGNRTQQYVQVGNAVPPYLARRIAQTLDSVLALWRSGPTRTQNKRTSGVESNLEPQ